jgi:crossover junction endodeoxyribonuclease RuvC
MGKLILGIDPGTSGAIAILDPESGFLEVHDVPTFELKVGKSKRKRVAIADLLSIFTDTGADMVDLAYLEKVGPQPRDGSASAFAFGEAVGAIKGCLSAALVPFTQPTPQEWKKEFKLNGKKGSDGEEAARQLAIELFPRHAELFKRKKDHNRADAALIALFGARQTLRKSG